MAPKIVLIVLGAAAAAVAAAALVIGGGHLLRQRSIEATIAAPEERFICLRSSLDFLSGAPPGCYAPQEIAAFVLTPLRDASGEAAAVELSPPSGGQGAPKTVRTCSDWRRLKGEGWYALSGRDMRREGWFERACGALAMLEKARKADLSHFEGGMLSQNDMDALAEASPFRIGEAQVAAMTAARTGPSEWRLLGGGQTAVIQEIAHADFSGDGLGDLLVFVTMRVEDGSAWASSTGYIEKTKASGPLRFVSER